MGYIPTKMLLSTGQISFGVKSENGWASGLTPKKLVPIVYKE